MKSLLIFVPQSFFKEEPGCMYGTVLHEDEKNITKFYILGLTESVQFTQQSNNGLVPLGYFYGREKKKEYWEKKLSNWIELCITPQTSSNYEFFIRNIMLKNQKLALISCHAVVILYDEYYLLSAELLFDKISTDHYSELRAILSKENIRKNQDNLKKAHFARINESIFSYVVIFFLYPIMWLCKGTNFINPILKYSSLGLHLAAWFENANWTLSTLLQTKRFTLKTTNYIVAMAIDMTLGLLLIKLILHFLKDSSPSDALLFQAEVKIMSIYINTIFEK